MDRAHFATTCCPADDVTSPCLTVDRSLAQDHPPLVTLPEATSRLPGGNGTIPALAKHPTEASGG